MEGSSGFVYIPAQAPGLTVGGILGTSGLHLTTGHTLHAFHFWALKLLLVLFVSIIAILPQGACVSWGCIIHL